MEEERFLENIVRIEIAHLVTEFRINETNWRDMLIRRYEDFVTRNSPKIFVDVGRGSIRDFSHLELDKNIIYRANYWQLGEVKDKQFILFPISNSIAWLDIEHSYVKIFIPKQTGIDLLNYLFTFILYSIFLPRQKETGILAHGCGITNNRNGFLFLAPSGEGKTTIAKLCGHRRIIHDDNLIIRKYKDKFVMYSTPWHREIDAPLVRSAIITKIFFNHRDKKNTINYLSKPYAFANLLKNCFIFWWDSKSKGSVSKFCEELIRKVPTYKLGFIPEKTIWDIIEEV